MLIDDFVRSAIKQDKRNVFEKTKLLSTCPAVSYTHLTLPTNSRV